MEKKALAMKSVLVLQPEVEVLAIVNWRDVFVFSGALEIHMNGHKTDDELEAVAGGKDSCKSDKNPESTLNDYSKVAAEDDFNIRWKIQRKGVNYGILSFKGILRSAGMGKAAMGSCPAPPEYC